MKLRFAVIGHPIKHTMSPFIHNSLFALQGKEVEYSTFDISPENLSFEMENKLSSLNGFNVTIPHKEAIIPSVDFVDESAKKYSAVNCVLMRDGKAYGYSTDAFGFRKALDSNGVLLKGRVAVLGCGGAARTLAREATDNGCEVTIAVREKSISKAKELQAWLIQNGGKATVTQLAHLSGEYDIIINATPIGMYPNLDNIPITKEQLSHCKAVFDAVYNPNKTLLLKTAEELKIKTVGGMSMLVWQAVKAHEIWYGASFKNEDIEIIIEKATFEMGKIFYEK